VWINQVDPLPEVWIYVLSLEFWPDAEIGTSYNPPVKRKVKIESESRPREGAIFRIDGFLQPENRLLGFSTNLSLRRTLNLIVTFIRYAPF